jgi:phosphatidylserine decarboxylase
MISAPQGTVVPYSVHVLPDSHCDRLVVCPEALLLGSHEFAAQFVGGTVYQAYLAPTLYHLWSSPVSGHVVYAGVIQGTYFSQSRDGGFGSSDHSQPYISHVATRAAVVFIRAAEPIGLMCFIAVGMADVSTCEIHRKFTAGWPQRVEKGEEIGMFHYGGSSHCLLFRKGVNLAWVAGAVPGDNKANLPIRCALAFAYQSSGSLDGQEGEVERRPLAHETKHE